MVTEELKELKERADAVVLAHYYTDGAVQEMADYVGDSFYLAKVAAKEKRGTIVFCGVRFMGESAKILNPECRVLLPDAEADCPMAHMADVGQIERLRAQVEDLAVVCYINSSARLKAHSDVCVTSSNAVKIVSALPDKNILFIPDQNLGSFVAKKCPQKTFYYSGGYCPVHAQLLAEDVAGERRAHPAAQVLVHPECTAEVVSLADFAGSTAEIIAYAEKSGAREFILGTEPGVLWELSRRCSGKTFYPVTPFCPDMKRISPEQVLACLTGGGHEVTLDAALTDAARRPLQRMLELGK